MTEPGRKDHKDLGIHTELLTPGMAYLIECGAANGRRKSLHRWNHVFTVALGDRHLYELKHDSPAMGGLPFLPCESSVGDGSECKHGIGQKGKSTRERASELINIAHPKFRDQLVEEGRKAIPI